ncbi:hypothetical protein FSP39_000431 [Pinctada imbricata]|uniref:Uncharacterized protein n=1 Tax=Pinctada imbricata TaxID=66713 RepID=A0AA89BIZ1_PINIB|nr:hypothetical protein FSP39_000431 [Pinctada imbricata]
MKEQWTNITAIFKELSKPFDDLINDAAKNKVFANVLGHIGLPVKPNNPLSKVNLSSLDKTNILQTQQVYINFLKKFNNDLKSITEEVHARDVLYTTVQEKTNKKDLIQDITSDVSDIFRLSSLNTLVKFGKGLKKKDIVCTTAILQIDQNEYDYYKLPPFRPICNVSQASFDIIEVDVSKRRNKQIMDQTVLIEAKKSDSTLASLLNTVKLAYSVQKSQNLKSFGASITKKDIACSVATQFPSIQMFDYIDLTKFRPSCSAVTKSQFDKMVEDSTRLRELDTKVEGLLNSCTLFNTCPCLPQIATAFKATETEVKASIKRVKPQMTEYCSLSCGCTKL